MTQIKKIKAEIERRIAALEKCGADKTEGYAGEISGLKRLLHFINSMSQEETNAVWHDASEKPKPDGELTKEWCEKKRILVYHSTNNVLIHKAYEYLNLKSVIKWAYIDDLLNMHKQEEVSEDLKEEMTRYFSKNPIKHPTDWPALKNTALHFANWQKEQMLKDAVTGNICGTDELDSGIDFAGLEEEEKKYNQILSQFNIGDKVKLIIAKED